MKILSAEQRKNIEIHELLQEIKYKAERETAGNSAFFEKMRIWGTDIKYNSENIKKNNRLRELENWGAVEIIDADNEEIDKALEESKGKGIIVDGWIVKPIEPKFSELCEKYEKIYHEIEGDNGGGGHQESDFKKTKNNKYWLEYTANRVIILNDKYIIHKAQLNRPSDEWFQYIFDHPGKDITIEEIRRETRREGTSFIKFLNNIKFKGQLRELFFEQGKRSIVFHNPITEENFTKKLINKAKLVEEISNLKKIESGDYLIEIKNLTIQNLVDNKDKNVSESDVSKDYSSRGVEAKFTIKAFIKK